MSMRVIWFACCNALLALALLPIPALCQSDDEPNDTIEQAVELQLPFMSVSGIVGTLTDLDFYSFSAAAHQNVTVWVQAPSVGSDLVPVVAAYDSSGNLIAYNEREWNLVTDRAGEDPILYLKTPAAGTYYILVCSIGAFRAESFHRGLTTGSYNLHLTAAVVGTSYADTYEPNDSSSSATLISLPFESDHASLLHFGDLDWYQFSGRKGQKISIDIDALEQRGHGSPLIVEARLGIFDANGRLIQSSTVGADPDSGYDLDPAIVFEVPRDEKYFVAVTIPPDEEFETAFANPAFLADPLVSSSMNRLGRYTLKVRLLQELWFPQIANGSFGAVDFKTTLLLINYSDRIATGNISLFKSDGSAMLTQFTEGTEATSSFWFSIPAGGSWVVKTLGDGPGTTGYAVLRATTPMGGCAVFSQYDEGGRLITEAAVAAAEPMNFLAFPVDVTGEFNTGLAIANAGNVNSASMYVKLLNTSGQVVATRSLSLDQGNQTAVFVSGAAQLFPAITGFRGSLQVISDTPVAAVALRTSAKTLTTLPGVTLNQPYDPVTLHFPQVVTGSGDVSYQSVIILTNPGYFPIAGTLQFRRADGAAMDVRIEGYHSSIHDFLVPPQGTLFLETAASGALETGYATVTADHGLGGAIIYSQFDGLTGALQTEVGVGSAEPLTTFRMFAEHEEGYNTGLAIANTSGNSSDLQYTLQPTSDPAALLQKGPIPLEPGAQRADLISGTDQIFPEFSGTGTLEVRSSQPVPAVALRITATTMTALPVKPVQ